MRNIRRLLSNGKRSEQLWNMINMNTAEDVADEDYEEGADYNEEEDQEVEEPRGLFGGRKSGRVVNMQQSVKMVITQPTTFEQAEEICDLLKEKKSVIINLEYVNKDVARRIIDVVSGAVHALEGHMQKISNSIFLIAPYNYDIATDSKEDVKSKLPVSWLKNN